MKQMNFMNSMFMLIGLVILHGMTGCQSEELHHEASSTFLVTRPVRMDTVTNKAYVCQIHSSQHIELRALEGGYLQETFVDEGQFVQKGQRMFQIMPALYQAEVQKAAAEVEFAEIEYQNTKSLADSNIVSKNELALAKATLDKAKAELALAQVHLDFTEVRAPFSGIMDRLDVRLGSLIEEGELLTTLSDNRQMWVYFNVPESEYLAYMREATGANGRQVQLVMANGEPFGYPGKITAIEADFDNRTGNIAFRATFPNPSGILRHGETGNILMESALDKALIIPQKATFEVLDQRFVFVLDSNDVVHATKISVAAELPHLFIIGGGITESDRILLEGLRKVKDGEAIATKYLQPESVVSDLALYAE